jgi:hypothetical protein
MKINSYRDFSALEIDAHRWNELLLNSSSKNIFLTYEWLKNWWAVFGHNKELLILTAEKNNKLLGIAPLYIEKVTVIKLFTLRQVCFLGDKHVGSDFLDFIIQKEQEHKVIPFFMDYLQRVVSWHRLVFDDINEDSPSLVILYNLSKKLSFSCYKQKKFACPYLVLPESIEHFIKLPDTTFKKIVSERNIPKLLRNHNIEIILALDCNNLEIYLERLCELFSERWQDYEWRNYLNDKKMREFYRRVSKALCEKNWLRLSAIKIDNKIEAMYYSMILGDSYYYLLGGCSKKGLEFRAGNILMFKVLESLIGNLRIYHFLRGAESYKYQWGAVDRFTITFKMARGFKGRFVLYIQIVINKLKKIAKVMRAKWMRFF